MLERFQDDHGWGQKVLEIYVRQDGSVEHKGELPDDPSSTPFVQVIFEDNRASLEKQAVWLENAMKFLHHEYGVEKINIVSHSMGGSLLLCTLNRRVTIPSCLRQNGSSRLPHHFRELQSHLMPKSTPVRL